MALLTRPVQEWLQAQNGTVDLRSPAYDLTVGLLAVAGIALVASARRHPGRWAERAAKVIGVILLADAVSWMATQATQGGWSPSTGLPLPLCDMAVLVAFAACWWRTPILVEITYFWGLAGTLQGVLTPDLSSPFLSLGFFQYTVGHVAIVIAALYLVLGLRLRPRRGAVLRVLAITASYTAAVGAVDGMTGADYMFLRSPPASWTLLSVLGPWPWYVFSATGVAVVLLLVLYAPFWWSSRTGTQKTVSAR
jgi:hypothetical integral membrane protein (TIGR02206 family)